MCAIKSQFLKAIITGKSLDNLKQIYQRIMQRQESLHTQY